MLRRTTLLLAMVAGSLLAGLAAPAHAIEDDPRMVKPLQAYRPLGGFVITVPTPEARCERSSGGNIFSPPYHFGFAGVAYFGNVPGNSGFRQWTLFRYRLDGVPSLGAKSNVTIRLYEAGTIKLEIESPDHVTAGAWHEVRPSSPAYTRATSDVTVAFEVIFDRPLRGDPRCTAITGRA